MRLDVVEGGGREGLWKVNVSVDDAGDTRRRERLRVTLLLLELWRIGLFSDFKTLVCSEGECDPLGDGISFKKDTNTDSSIRL